MNKDRPILFSGEMVRALLDGRKTMTRRIIKPQPKNDACISCSMSINGIPQSLMWVDQNSDNDLFNCKYGKPGDFLWVRETWKPDEIDCIAGIKYRADDTFIEIKNTSQAADNWLRVRKPEEQWPEMKEPVWRPSIFMPRWASRITQKIINVRVERLQDISEEDSHAEGVLLINCEEYSRIYGSLTAPQYRYGFYKIWQEINGNWDENPWVWVIEFEVIHKNIDEVLKDLK